jgi:hypothetical protein
MSPNLMGTSNFSARRFAVIVNKNLENGRKRIDRPLHQFGLDTSTYRQLIPFHVDARDSSLCGHKNAGQMPRIINTRTRAPQLMDVLASPMHQPHDLNPLRFRRQVNGNGM